MLHTFRTIDSCSSVLRSSTRRSKYYTFIEEVTGSNVVPAHIDFSVLFLSFPSGMSLKDTLKEDTHTYSKSYLLTDSVYGISDYNLLHFNQRCYNTQLILNEFLSCYRSR